MSDSTHQSSDDRAASSDVAPPNMRVFRSDELFAGERMIVIEHSGSQYRLMITRNDRLILQK